MVVLKLNHQGFSIILFSILSLVLFFISGCATPLITSIPFAEVQTSETNGGDMEFAYEIGYGSVGSIYQFTDSVSSRPPNLNSQSVSKYQGLFLSKGALNFTPHLDLSFVMTPYTGLQVKYQILGKPTLTSHEGDHSLSLYGSIGYVKLGMLGGTSDGGYLPKGYEWEAASSNNISEVGFSYGYRIKVDKLLYAGYALASNKLKAKIDQYPKADGSLLGGSYLWGDYFGNNQSLGIGYEQGLQGKINFQAGINQLEMKEIKTQNGYLKIAFNYSFAQKPENLISGKTKLVEMEAKESWQWRDYVGLPFSVLVGFGTGQAFQKRWSSSGFYFTIVDAVSFLSIPYLANSTPGVTSSVPILYLVSRIWQIVDVALYANKSEVPKSINP